MILSIGTQARDFTLQNSHGKPVSLSRDLAGQPVVLFFYPKDFTTVCTAEVCAFRDAYSELKASGVHLFGISKDSVETHAKFMQANRVPFDLLADLDKAVAKAYGALMPVLGLPNRVTYLLDKDHKVALSVAKYLSAQAHVDAVLEKVEAGLN